tara:strand:+ start:8 stop:1216 length:1209 start_codon:yes stop_codon:yes gene_type:complete
MRSRLLSCQDFERAQSDRNEVLRAERARIDAQHAAARGDATYLKYTADREPEIARIEEALEERRIEDAKHEAEAAGATAEDVANVVEEVRRAVHGTKRYEVCATLRATPISRSMCARSRATSIARSEYRPCSKLFTALSQAETKWNTRQNNLFIASLGVKDDVVALRSTRMSSQPSGERASQKRQLESRPNKQERMANLEAEEKRREDEREEVKPVILRWMCEVCNLPPLRTPPAQRRSANRDATLTRSTLAWCAQELRMGEGAARNAEKVGQKCPIVWSDAKDGEAKAFDYRVTIAIGDDVHGTYDDNDPAHQWLTAAEVNVPDDRLHARPSREDNMRRKLLCDPFKPWGGATEEVRLACRPFDTSSSDPTTPTILLPPDCARRSAEKAGGVPESCARVDG